MKHNTEGATSVYLNGNIYTVDDSFTTEEALVVKNELILYVGSNEVAKKFVATDTEVFDLEGKTVLPGLIEGHTHFGWLSQSLVEIDGIGKTKEEILDAIGKKAANAKGGEWILGRGWNNEVWSNTDFPTKEDIDKVAPNNPVCMIRTCCHAYWVNSKALEIAGISQESVDPEGGEIVRHDDGHPSGMLIDTAGNKLTEKIPPYVGEKQLDALRKGQEYITSFGLTSIMDAGATIEEIDAMKTLCENGEMRLRLYVYAVEGDAASYYYKKGVEIGLYNNTLTVRGVKLFADGSSGARSAYLLDDYADRPGHRGMLRYTDEQMLKAVRDARLNGFQLSVHVNGDGSVEQVIDAYTKVLNELPLKDNRYRLEHYQLITEEQLKKTVDYKFRPSMQAVQCTSDRLMIEERYGKDKGRLERSYPWRSIIDSGLHIVNGSDAPVELVNPYHGLYACVTRKGRDEQPEGGWFPDQCMTREEALKSFTIWAQAYAWHGIYDFPRTYCGTYCIFDHGIKI